MGCASCGVGKDGVPSGCGNKGHCQSGGCNKKNTFDWFSIYEIKDAVETEFVELSFKNGQVKHFYRKKPGQQLDTGDIAVVEADRGFDIGVVTLSSELVNLQMRKKKMDEDRVIHKVVRVAHERDLERLEEVRLREKEAMVRARKIASDLGINMKISDVMYRGDGKKLTVYYIADGRIDFRQLVKDYARAFRVKIEMKQIGVRQEAALVGGLGVCGRELCCSTWISEFKSVSTAAARYQNLSINQTKLSGHCGRLKCCLNYELDTYIESMEDFPDHIQYLEALDGKAKLLKMDIFKSMMYFTYDNGQGRPLIIPLKVSAVKEVYELNQQGKKPISLMEYKFTEVIDDQEYSFEEDLTGVIELPVEKKKRRNSRNKRRGSSGSKSQHRGKGGKNKGRNRNHSKGQSGRKSDKKKN